MDHRYIRQTQLKDFGPLGQQRLAEAKVLVVGLGGLGLPALQYLNAMGVGTLGLMDRDRIELHNLQRQILYGEMDVGRPKLDVAHERLRQQNPTTQFRLHDCFLTVENALDILGDYDLVVDATDNFPTRYLINDACVILGKAFVYGALHGFEGHISVFNHLGGPTYRCLYPNMPGDAEMPDCNTNGVLGIIPGIIGNLQALEVVKILTGMGEVLSGKLLLFDGLAQSYTKIGFKANPANLLRMELQGSYEPVACEPVPGISTEDFQAELEANPQLFLMDVRNPEEFARNHLEQAINVPMDRLQHPQVPFPQRVYVICQSGKRSGASVFELQKRYPGSQFLSVLGGMNKMMSLCP